MGVVAEEQPGEVEVVLSMLVCTKLLSVFCYQMAKACASFGKMAGVIISLESSVTDRA